MTDIQILTVENSSQLKRFINFSWSIYRADANWVPPLKNEVRNLLDFEQHPFWKIAEGKLFLAVKSKEIVGRIAGIVNHRFNQFHQTKAAQWGFFECINNPEVGRELFRAVESWARSYGMEYLSGPFNPSSNYEVGILIEGFQHRATLMMPYNPPYYANLLESAGYRKEKDLLSFIAGNDWQPQEWMRQFADRIVRSGNCLIRSIDRGSITEDLAIIKEMYDECWSGNWGFVPMTDEEYAEMSRYLLRIADLDFASIVFYKGEPVGLSILVPDINPVLKRLNGKLGLIGLVKVALYKNEIKGLRGLMFGIKKPYRALGIPFVALEYLYKKLQQRPEYEYVEFGWNLEENKDINQLEMDCGANIFKKYRIYRKNLP